MHYRFTEYRNIFNLPKIHIAINFDRRTGLDFDLHVGRTAKPTQTRHPSAARTATHTSARHQIQQIRQTHIGQELIRLRTHQRIDFGADSRLICLEQFRYALFHLLVATRRLLCRTNKALHVGCQSAHRHCGRHRTHLYRKTAQLDTNQHFDRYIGQSHRKRARTIDAARSGRCADSVLEIAGNSKPRIRYCELHSHEQQIGIDGAHDERIQIGCVRVGGNAVDAEQWCED